MNQEGKRRGARIFRWVVCGVATLTAVLHVIHLGGDILFSQGGTSNVTTMNVALASLLGLYCASLLLCWKWLAASGWLSLAAIGIFVGLILGRGMVPVWSIWWAFLLTLLMLTLPSLLLLAGAWVSRAPKHTVPTE